jgi:pyruvate dehydrogenase E2 component (dihydrolipoamide acetyltransferase)
MARELSVDLSNVKGSGPRGRITPADVREYLTTDTTLRVAPLAAEESVPIARGGKVTFEVPPSTNVDFAEFGSVEQQPLSRIRKISGARLHRSRSSIPHVTNHDDADVTELEALRGDVNRENEKSGVRISPLAFVMKACVATLRAFPEFNASLEGESLILKRYYHVGFAADTPNGLVVPVIRDAERKGVVEMAREMAELV